MTDENAAPPPVEGRLGRTFAGSEGSWPERPTRRPAPPTWWSCWPTTSASPTSGATASEIATPNLDALAARGVRYTNFHVTPMCSPTRSSLLTGLDHHRAGFGTVAHLDPGFPGYAMELPDDTATLPEILRDHGYATLMVGKWHLAKDSDCSAAGPQHSWPCQRGFDRFFGFLDAFTNLHQPHRLTEDNHQVEVDRYPDDYYLTDDLTDRAVAMVRERKASNPDQPFLLYFAHGAVHAPLQAKAVDMARYRGAYRAGWDASAGRALPAPARPRRHRRGHAVGPSQHRSQPRRAAVGRAQRARAAPLRPAHGGLRRHGRQHRPERGSPHRRARGAGGARQHHLHLHLRQRCLPRGGGLRHELVLRPPAAGRRRGRRPGPHRPARRTADHPALPAGMGHGLQHAAAPLQDQHPRRRSHRAVHRVVARAAGRPRRGAAPPVHPHHRPAADAAGAHRRRAAGRAPRGRAGAPGRDQLRPHPDRGGRRRAGTPARWRR